MKVAVVGLGSTGAMALWLLSRMPGVTAVGFEQFGIGHPHGGYSGESRLFRMAYHEGAKYVPLLRRARGLWSELQGASGRDLFSNVSVLTIGRESDDTFLRLIESAEQHHLRHERLNADTLRSRYPQFDIAGDESGMFDLEGGALRPELGVLSAIEQAQINGAIVREHEAIHAIEEGPNGVEVVSAAGEERFDRVILTAGAWSKRLIPDLAARTELRKILLTWFVPREAERFQASNFPGFIRDRGGFHVFGAPMLDGYSVKISGDVEGPLDTDSPDEMDLRIDDGSLAAFGSKVVELFPDVWPEPVRYSVHCDSYTADKTPIIDTRGNVVVVAGLSGHGFKLAPALGELAAELAAHGESPLWREEFSFAAHPHMSIT